MKKRRYFKLSKYLLQGALEETLNDKEKSLLFLSFNSAGHWDPVHLRGLLVI